MDYHAEDLVRRSLSRILSSVGVSLYSKHYIDSAIMVYYIEDLVRESLSEICLAISLYELIVAVTIKAYEYTDGIDHDTIQSYRSSWMLVCQLCFALLPTGLKDGFKGLE